MVKTPGLLKPGNAKPPAGVPNETSKALPGVPLLTRSAEVIVMFPAFVVPNDKFIVAEPVVKAFEALNPTSPAPVTFSVIEPDVAESPPLATPPVIAALPVISRPVPLMPVDAVKLMPPLTAVSKFVKELGTVAFPVVRSWFTVMAPPAVVRAIEPLAVPLVTEAPVIIPEIPSTVPTVKELVSV